MPSSRFRPHGEFSTVRSAPAQPLSRWRAAFCLLSFGCLLAACCCPIEATGCPVPPDPNPPDTPCPSGKCCPIGGSGGPNGGGGPGPTGPLRSAAPILIARGAVVENVVDLSLGGSVFPWLHRRGYDSLRIVAGVGEVPTDSGIRWEGTGRGGPYFTLDGSSNATVYIGASAKRVFPLSMGSYTAPADYMATLVKSGSGVNEIYTLTQTDDGKVFIFHGYDAAISNDKKGRLKEETTREYQVQGLTGTQFTYDAATGYVSQIVTADPQSWAIDYTYYSSSSEVGRLQKVEVKDGSSNVIMKAEYTYYGNVTSPSTDIGSTGDLVMVQVSKRDSAMSGWIVRTTQYRYYKSGDSDGKPHQLKAVFESDAVDRINSAGDTAVDTVTEILTKADNYSVASANNVSVFASRSFTYYTSDLNTTGNITTAWGTENLNTKYGGANLNEYDATAYGLVKSETVNGSCASCGGGGEPGAGVKHTYYHMILNSGTSGDRRVVIRVVVEDTTDASATPLYRKIWGLNFRDARLREAFIEDPTAGTLKAWCESTIIDSDLRMTAERAPSAHTLVDSNTEMAKFLDPTTSTNDADTLNTSDGLITTYTYNADKRPTGTLVQKGSSGTAYYLSATDWGDGSTVPAYLEVATYTYPTKTATRASGIATSYAYTFWDGGKQQIKKKTTTLPAIGTGQNGSNTATTMEEYYDKLGRLRWTVDGEGYINYLSYQPDTGAVAYQVVDVNPSSMPGSATGNDTKWVSANEDGDGNGTYDSGGKPTRSGGLVTALALVTSIEYDSQGRPMKRTEPSGSLHYTIYQTSRVIEFPYWDAGNSKTLAPIRVTVVSNGDQVTQMFSVRASYTSISTASSAPTGFSSEPGQSDYVRWKKNSYTAVIGQRDFVDSYHDVPSSGSGTLSTNFHRTVYRYDSRGRREYTVQVVSGTSSSASVEQVTQQICDVRDRVIEVKSGVSSASHDMTSGYTTYPTLVSRMKTKYDADGVGDGHITKQTSYHGLGGNDYTGVNFYRTYRGHLRGEEPFYHNGSSETAAGPYAVCDVDWQGKTTQSGQYISNPTWATVLTGDNYTAYADSTGTNRRMLTETLYDDLGRPYHTLRYAIDTSSGAKGNYFLTDFYYDRNGRQVANAPNADAATEMAYDGAGRRYQTRTVLALESSKYSSGAFQYRDPIPNPSRGSMSGGDDRVVLLEHSAFDSFGNATEQHSYEANHDDGTAGIDLSNNDDYVRRSVYSWFDAADRLTATGDYGSGDTAMGAGQWKYATVPSRGGSAPGSSSDTVLVTAYTYNSASGELETVADPKATVTKTFYDDLDRTIYVAENYDDFDPATSSTIGDMSDTSKDRVVKTEYNGLGSTAKLTAYNGSSSADEVTTYLFEDAVDASRVTSEIYPDSSDADSSGTDQVKIAYATDGRVTQRTDQRQAVIAFAYDNLRRPKSQKVTSLGDGGQNVDGNVRSITRGYDSLGRVSKITSHGNQTDDPDNTTTVRNQVVFTYNDLGQVTKTEQAHGSTVGMGTPAVQYAYDTSASGSVFDDGARLESVTYPSGRIIFNDYGSASTLTDLYHLPYRIRETNGAGTILTEYSYTGRRRMVIADYPAPDFKLDLFRGTTSTYAGLDRFARTIDQFWDGYGSTSDVDRFKYAYDYAGSRTYRDIDASIYATNTKDQAYTYDNLHRLLTSKQGTLSGSTISGTPATEENFTLDAIGNWSNYTTKASGSTTLNQDRTHNDANETTALASVSTHIAHDNAGNTIKVPKPTSWSAHFDLIYDAWNRLVQVNDGMNTVAIYSYDGRNYRVKKAVYASGVLSYTDHTYYNDDWQTLEVRREISGVEDTDPREQFVWHPDYIDSLAVRYYDADTDANLAENNDGTHYYAQDANYNVTAVVDGSGTLLERYQYDPYGNLTVLDSNFATDADGLSDIDNLITYTGRSFDGESALYQFRFRFFAPILGRFINRDLFKYIDSLNLYAYAASNPLIYLDPSGGFVQIIGGVIGGAVIGGIVGGISTGSIGGAVIGAIGGAAIGGIAGATLGGSLLVYLPGVGAVQAGGSFGGGVLVGGALGGAGVGAAIGAGTCLACMSGDFLDRLQKAKEAFRNNADFRRWWHRNYKSTEKGGSIEKNPDLGDDAIVEGWEEWNSNGCPSGG